MISLGAISTQVIRVRRLIPTLTALEQLILCESYVMYISTHACPLKRVGNCARYHFTLINVPAGTKVVLTSRLCDPGT